MSTSENSRVVTGRWQAMLAALLLLLRVLPAWAAAKETDYSAIFGSKYAEAEKFLRDNSWLGPSLKLTPSEIRIAEAVVFPEIVRYCILQDQIEVRALKVLYVQAGEEYANFSIGQFQMKPTFAEQVERDYNRLFSSTEQETIGVPSFPIADSSQLRNQRVLRLDDFHWQAQYLRLFMMIMARRYKEARFSTDTDKLRFYATAYNAGYHRGERAIRAAMNARRYHVELFAPRIRYNYADVATGYYRSH